MLKSMLFKLFALCCVMLSGTGSALSQNAIAIDSAGNLLRFSVATPGTIAGSVAITGLQAGETIVDIDFRPANGLLYGLGVAATVGRLYTINTTTGAATLVSILSADPADATSPFAALSGTRFAIDFIPVPDRLRIVSDTGMDLRVNPGNGLVITDDDLNPGTPAIGGN